MPFLESKQISMVKGFAIIGVVAIHLIDFLLRFEVFQKLSLETRVFSLLVYEISIVGVPLFIFLSALVFKPKHLDRLDDYLLKRLKKLLIPYLIWTAIYLQIYYGGVQNVGLDQLHTFFLFGWSHLYFIVLMVQFSLIAPFAYLLMKRKYAVLIPLGFQLFLLSDVYFHSVLKGTTTFKIQELFSLSLFWIGYFCLGAYLASRTIKYHFLLPLIGLLVSGYFVFRDVLDLYVEQQISSVYSLSYFRPAVFTMTFSSILLLPFILRFIPKYLDTVLEKIGQLSFGIFLVHLLVIRFGLSFFKINTHSVLGLTTAIGVVVLFSALITFAVSQLPYFSLLFGEEKLLHDLPFFSKKQKKS